MKSNKYIDVLNLHQSFDRSPSPSPIAAAPVHLALHVCFLRHLQSPDLRRSSLRSIKVVLLQYSTQRRTWYEKGEVAFCVRGVVLN